MRFPGRIAFPAVNIDGYAADAVNELSLDDSQVREAAERVAREVLGPLKLL